jgi:hypothetical protein
MYHGNVHRSDPGCQAETGREQLPLRAGCLRRGNSFCNASSGAPHLAEFADHYSIFRKPPGRDFKSRNDL